MITFTHVFEEDPPLSDLSVEISPPEGAIVGVRVDGNSVLLCANGQGFMHLAKLFAELGMRDLEDEYHFHVGPNFEEVDYDPGKELTVMRLNHALPEDEQMVRNVN